MYSQIFYVVSLICVLFSFSVSALVTKANVYKNGKLYMTYQREDITRNKVNFILETYKNTKGQTLSTLKTSYGQNGQLFKHEAFSGKSKKVGEVSKEASVLVSSLIVPFILKNWTKLMSSQTIQIALKNIGRSNKTLFLLRRKKHKNKGYVIEMMPKKTELNSKIGVSYFSFDRNKTFEKFKGFLSVLQGHQWVGFKAEVRAHK